MCTLRYVCVHWGRDSSVQNELTKTEGDCVHLNHCTSVHSPHPAWDPNQNSLAFKWSKNPRTPAEMTRPLDCILMQGMDGRWKPRLTGNRGLHSRSNLLVISTQYPLLVRSFLLETVNTVENFHAYIWPSVLNLSDLLRLLSDCDVIGIDSYRHFCVLCSEWRSCSSNIHTLIYIPPVKWHPVSSLKLHHQFIKERMPALFQESSGDNVVSTHLRITGPS